MAGRKKQMVSLNQNEERRREKLILVFKELLVELDKKRDGGGVPYAELQECIHVGAVLRVLDAKFAQDSSRNDASLEQFLLTDEQKKFFRQERISSLKGFLGQSLNLLKFQMAGAKVPCPAWLEMLHKAFHRTEVVVPAKPQQWFSPIFSVDILEMSA